MNFTFGKKTLPEGLNVRIDYEFNQLSNVGSVAKTGGVRRVAAHEGDNNTPLGPKD